MLVKIPTTRLLLLVFGSDIVDKVRWPLPQYVGLTAQNCIPSKLLRVIM